jgi:hypothetical protein
VKRPSLPVRASDADRERAVRALRTHHLAGRMTAEEFERRIELAYAATTRDELEELVEDLPRRGGVVVPATARRKPLLPGLRSFAISFEADLPADAVLEEAMRVVAPNLIGYGYQLEPGQPNRLVFTLPRDLTPLLALLVPIIGLLGLLFARYTTSQVILTAREVGHGRTVVDVFGAAPVSVRRAMVELEQSS